MTRELGKLRTLPTSSTPVLPIMCATPVSKLRPPSPLPMRTEIVRHVLDPQVPPYIPGVHPLRRPPIEPGVQFHHVPPDDPGVHCLGSPPATPVAAPTYHPSAGKALPAGMLKSSDSLQVTHRHPYPRDRLDEHVERAARAFQQAATYGDFIRHARGRGDLHSDVGTLPHPAANLLAQYQRSGTPVIMQTENWTNGRTQAALERGPHSSSQNGIDFLREEYADMIDKQQWTVLPAHLVMGLDKLRLSPLGLVPQRGRSQTTPTLASIPTRSGLLRRKSDAIWKNSSSTPHQNPSLEPAIWPSVHVQN